ncbi:MAG TPA: hypothetical protein VHE35_13620, partial [Kofleriaceae bacterium]|nr:hypothetical protein [Kofleriaceae bacterium]
PPVAAASAGPMPPVAAVARASHAPAHPERTASGDPERTASVGELDVDGPSAPALTSPAAPASPSGSFATPPAERAPRARPAPSPSVVPRGWRDELVAWVRAGSPSPAPTLDGSALRGLHLRLGLTAAAWPILATLYGRWLLGGGAHGVSTARLAAIAADAGAWPEALGAGSLGAHGLVEWRHGRACLSAAAGDFLDERAPGGVELVGDARRRAPEAGQGKLLGDGPGAARDHASQLAGELGQVALWTGGLGRELATARLEAWLRGLALVVLGDPGPLALRPDEAIVSVVSRSP